jgi:hypothetical protein
MITIISGFLINILLLISSGKLIGSLPEEKRTVVVLKPGGTSLMTDVIQQAIDSCSGQGGGLVRFTEGIYYSGTIQMRNNITLLLDKGPLKPIKIIRNK